MSWSDFDHRKRGNDPEDSVTPDDIDEILTSLFITDNGQKVLLWLRKKTKERVLPPNAPESALRHLEGMRHLVHEIETRVAKGRKEDAGRYREQLATAASSARSGSSCGCGCIFCKAGRFARRLA